MPHTWADDHLPGTDNSYDLGSDSFRWADIVAVILRARHTTPAIDLEETDAAADNGVARIVHAGEEFIIRIMNDAKSAQSNILKATRTGTTVDDVTIYGANILADAFKLDSAAITGHAGAADTAGADVFAETEDGGAASADTDGVDGGDLSIKGGDGSAGGAHTSNNPDGGNGGSITLTVGAGGAAGSGGAGVAGDPGKVQISGGLLHFNTVQTIDMSDAAVTLTLNPGTPTGTLLTSNVLRVDPNSLGAGEDLTLPPEADCAGVLLWIVNTGGENVVVKDDGASTIDTVATTEFGIFMCDGTAWTGMNKA